MIKKLKAFIYIFKQSAFDVNYYKELLTTKFSFTLKYLVTLFFVGILLGLIIPTITIYHNLPKINQFGTEINNTFKQLYPKELVFQIKNGQVMTNVRNPYYIYAKYEGKRIPLMVINTEAEVEDYPNYRTLILVTKDSIVYPDSSRSNQPILNNYRVNKFDSKTNLPVFTYNDYNKIIKQVDPLFSNLGNIVKFVLLISLIFIPILATLFKVLWILFVTLIDSLIFWVINKLMKKNLTYSQIYRLSLHGLTLPSLVVFTLGLFNYHLSWIYSLVYLVFMILVLRSFKPAKKKTK